MAKRTALRSLSTAEEVLQSLRAVATPERAEVNKRFFKTGKGQYGEGDRFLGVTVPATRMVVRQAKSLPFFEIAKLLDSSFHEVRLCGLLILAHQYSHEHEEARKKIFCEYLRRIPTSINNWDLVDTTAPHIVGAWLEDKSKDQLYRLAKSANLWERRVAIVATQHFIRLGKCADAFAISDLLLRDSEDLIHKAAGWMLREVGKYCGMDLLEEYLLPRIPQMPRTMLRYAIERFPVEKKLQFMRK